MRVQSVRVWHICVIYWQIMCLVISEEVPAQSMPISVLNKRLQHERVQYSSVLWLTSNYLF